MSTSYQSYLLAANPSNPRDNLSQSVILVVQHDTRVTVGIQINVPLANLRLNTVMEGFDIFYEQKDPVFHGGNLKVDKIQVIHSLDWMGLTSVQLNDHLALTGDLSILTAIAAGEGPNKFKACAGFWAWEPGMLEKQVESKNKDIVHKWEITAATEDLVFDQLPENLWEQVIRVSTKEQIDSWF